MMDDEKAVFPGLDHAVLSGSQLAKADPAVVLARLQAALTVLRAGKPSDRSETARRYAVTITEMEKVVAYFKMYVVDGDDPSTYDSADDQVRSGYEDAKIDSPCDPLD